MKEIEILVQIYNDEKTVLDCLEQFEFMGNKRTIDTYYTDPLRNDLKPDSNGRLTACFRTRQKDGKNYITYKKDHFNGDKWLYSDESETIVDSMETMEDIIKSLGLVQLLKIDNSKQTYKHKDYVIEFESVKDLGLFLEVEFCTDDDVDVIEIKSEIQKFIDSLGIQVSKELNAGKPELMLRKQTLN